MSETLSERFVKSFNDLEDSQVSASDYMAWQRWLYRKKLNDAGVKLPEIHDTSFEEMPGLTEGERYLDIFESLSDDLAFCEEHYNDAGVVNIHELVIAAVPKA